MKTIEQCVAQVVSAWENPGPRPDIHTGEMSRLNKRWPTLWLAVKELVQAARQPKKEDVCTR